MSSRVPRCGDRVRHGPSGHVLVVAWCQRGTLAGRSEWFPKVLVGLETCQPIRRASEAQHRAEVERWRAAAERSEWRARVLRLYGRTARL